MGLFEGQVGVHYVFFERDKLQIVVKLCHLFVETVLPVHSDIDPKSSPTDPRHNNRSVRLGDKLLNRIWKGLVKLHFDQVSQFVEGFFSLNRAEIHLPRILVIVVGFELLGGVSDVKMYHYSFFLTLRQNIASFLDNIAMLIFNLFPQFFLSSDIRRFILDSAKRTALIVANDG